MMDVATQPPPAKVLAVDRLHEAWPVAALTAAMGALVFWHLGRKSIWRDEGFSISTSLRSWPSLARLTIHKETNGALYAFTLKAWSAFGQSETALRSLSAVSVVALVPAVYSLTRRLASQRAALLAGALVVAHGSVVTYGQQIRTYGPSMLLAAVASILFVEEVRAPRWIMLVGWAAVSVALVYCHTMGITLIVGQLAALLLLPRADRHLVRRVGTAVIVGVLVSPVPILVSAHEEGQGLFALTLGMFRDVLYVMTGRAGAAGLVAFGLLAVLTAHAVPACRRAGDGWARWSLGYLMVASAVPAGLMVAYSAVRPVLIGRYLLFLLPGVLALGGIVLDHTLGGDRPKVLARPAVSVLVVLAILLGVGRGAWWWVSDGGVEDWRAAATVVFSEAKPGDAVLFANDSVRLFFEYYRGRIGHQSEPEPVYPPPAWGSYGTGDQTYASFTAAEADQALASHQRVWFVVGRKHAHVAEASTYLDQLAKEGVVTEVHWLGHDVHVVLAERHP